MVGYWPGSFFASLWTETQLRSINTQKKKKKDRGQYPDILTEQAWIYYMAFGKLFSCEARRVVPSGQDSSILPARVANHSARFGSSCPLTELAV